MIKKTTIRLEESLFNEVMAYSEKNDLKSFNNITILALESYIKSNGIIMYNDGEKELIDHLKDTISNYKKEIIKRDEQLKVKDQQIFSLIAVQKDLTEKTTEQVKLLGDQMKSKKWYHFWK